jgi:uncharacterized membrane protein
MSARKGKRGHSPRFQRLFYTLMIANGVSLLLFALRSLESQSDRYWFLIWNLVLAWLPLAFVWCLLKRVRTTPWLSWQNVALSLLWLGFLPNSFYLVSDLIHLHTTGEVSLLYDAVMFCSFIFNAYVAGFMSLVLMHRLLLTRIAYKKAFGVILTVLLACSFAIYLGRSLRWNTWDVLVNPAGLLFDVSDRIVHPGSHPQALVTTATFFLLLGSMYLVIWEFARVTTKNGVGSK